MTHDRTEGTTELDSHADTSVVGCNALILQDYDRPVHVTGYDAKNMGSRVYRTVSAAIAYDDPKTGDTVILVIHQAILIPQLKHNLLCPMQLRHNDVELDEKPKFLTKNPTEKSHAIAMEDVDGNQLVIPLHLKGVTSYFSSRKPTIQEYENADLKFELTYDSPEWDPTLDTFQEQEDATMNLDGSIRDVPKQRELSICQIECALRLNDDDFDLD